MEEFPCLTDLARRERVRIWIKDLWSPEYVQKDLGEVTPQEFTRWILEVAPPLISENLAIYNTYDKRKVVFDAIIKYVANAWGAGQKKESKGHGF